MRPALVALACVGTVVLVGAPLLGWPGVVRLPAVILPLVAAAGWLAWRARSQSFSWQAVNEWAPTERTVWMGAAVIGLLLFWLVLTRFKSGEVNAIDFTVYFDRPCVQTIQGRPLNVETGNDRPFPGGSSLAHHAYWIMLPLCGVYAISATPLWLLATSVLAVVIGAVFVLRIVTLLGLGGALATATALAFVFNDNTARTLNYGFHPEVLYACFIPWLIYAGLRRHPRSFIAAAVASVMVKEDAILPLFAVSVALGLSEWRQMHRSARMLFLAFPVVLASLNLAVFYLYVIPAVAGDGRLVYESYWEPYGPTPVRALFGMLSQPGSVVAGVLASGFFSTVVWPHLLLPFAAWRWLLGVVPLVAIFGASSDPQLREFAVYYAILAVPFLTIGASVGGVAIATKLLPRFPWPRLAVAAVIFGGALIVGSDNRGYSLRPWSTETAGVPEALRRLANEPLVLVQSGLYPHAGYEARVQLLTPETLADPRFAGAALLLAPAASRFPFEADSADQLSKLPQIRAMPPGLVAVRRP